MRSLIAEALEVCERCKLELDPWQKFAFERSLGLRNTGKWASREVGICVPRQNGKGAILEARELAGLFVFGERLIIHSAHQFDTSIRAFIRMQELLEEGGLTVELKSRSGRAGSGISRSHGQEGFMLRTGQELNYRTRTKSGARGFSGDLVIFDEAMILPEDFLSAMGPIISAKTIDGNPQVWYTGSAVDQYSMEHGIVFARARQRGMRGSPALCWFEWAGNVDPELTPMTGMELLDDREAWRRANPALGIRISEEYIEETELNGLLGPRGFMVERLGVGDWPNVEEGAVGAIAIGDWLALIDERSELASDVVFAFDISPLSTSASIMAAGRRSDDLYHVELVEHRKGTKWVVPRLRELEAKHRPDMILYDGRSPAAALKLALEGADVGVTEVTTTQYGEACGLIVDLVTQREVRHLGSPELTAAVRGADTSPMGDAWKWSRRRSSADITPLVAATLALWGASQLAGDSTYDPTQYWAAA